MIESIFQILIALYFYLISAKVVVFKKIKMWYDNDGIKK